MTNKRSATTRLKLCLGLASLLSLSALAQAPIYDNSVNDKKFRFNPGTLQVGDEIIVAGGAGQYLTKFSFEFYGTNNTGGVRSPARSWHKFGFT